MLRIERFDDPQGNRLAGFFVRNGVNKVVAIGADCANGFVMPSRKRYARDLDLCKAISQLTGQPIKWNLVMYGNHISSGTRQELMQKIRRSR